MSKDNQLKELVSEFIGITQETVQTDILDESEVRRVLSFVSQMIKVVEQAFQDAFTLLIDIKHLDDKAELVELHKKADLLTSRSFYRDAMEVCSKLKHLHEYYDRSIRDSVEKLPGLSNWSGILGLINEHEGRIIIQIQNTAEEISKLLDEAEWDLAGVKLLALQQSKELQKQLAELHDLNGRILGLSGKSGFLEMTKNRHEIEKEIHIMIDNRDQSITHGHRVSITGDNNHDIVVADLIKNSFNRTQNAVDNQLRDELEALCKAVEDMIKTLPEKAAREVSQDLNTLVNEVTSETPRKKWYELSADGLVEAAKACAGMASPVIKSVKLVLKLLG